MKRIFGFILCLICMTASVSSVAAATIDFESYPAGSSNPYTYLTNSEVTISNPDGGEFYLTLNSSGYPPLSGQALSGVYQSPDWPVLSFKAEFLVGKIQLVSIDVGDYGADKDNCYLEAYNNSDALIGQDYYFNPAGNKGGDTMSLETDESISYVLFYDTAPYAGAIIWDNLSYEAVPIPGAVWLLGSGLIGLIGIRKRNS